ncbi:MAG: hypothetical protein L0Y80_00560 [Ignavibacteriae bacterium]|nr:hypothetical protein [Ignavibacteriota bacterium]
MSVYHEAKGSPIYKGIIVALLALLVYVVYEPYTIKAEEEAWRAESRARMLNIRAAQLQYINRFYRYNSSLDSLVTFIKDSLISTNPWQTYFVPLEGGEFSPESLLRSPKSGQPYQFTAVDTTRIKKYELICPDGYGSIGSLTDDGRVNKASWTD